MSKIIHRIDVEREIENEKKFDPTATYSGGVILFLDFDGVLHSYEAYYTKKNMFNKLPLLLKVLDKVPNAKVVVSSSWAKKRRLEELKLFFPDKYRNRIVGAIHSQTDYRHADVKNYIKERGILDPWIAVDDMALYEPTDPVVWTDWSTGLTDETANVLMNALKSPIEFKEFRKKDK